MIQASPSIGFRSEDSSKIGAEPALPNTQPSVPLVRPIAVCPARSSLAGGPACRQSAQGCYFRSFQAGKPLVSWGIGKNLHSLLEMLRKGLDKRPG